MQLCHQKIFQVLDSVFLKEYKKQSQQLMKKLEVKTQCNTNRDLAKISVLSSGKIDKYEYLTCEEMISSG